MFDVIYADPPWRYDFSKSDSRQVENQYPTMTTDEIAALQVPANKNAVLYLWATAPKLRDALIVMKRWGFEYKTHAVWDKMKVGMGYWFRGRHELLLVGVKGKFSPPEADERWSSIFTHPRTEHSKKPSLHLTFELWFPGKQKLEMFARSKLPIVNWKFWGNEVDDGVKIDSKPLPPPPAEPAEADQWAAVPEENRVQAHDDLTEMASYYEKTGKPKSAAAVRALLWLVTK